MKKLIYKPIEGFEGYFVCNSGVNEQTILSTMDNVGRPRFLWLKPIYDRDGYIQVSLKGKLKRMHRIVAKAFIPNPDDKPCVDHINGIRDDNRIENLRWCTHKENDNFPLAKKHRSEAMKKLGLKPMLGKHHSEETRRKMSEGQTKKPVKQYTKEGVLVAIYTSLGEASRETGVGIGHIWYVCNNKRNSAGGYKWAYLD